MIKRIFLIATGVMFLSTGCSQTVMKPQANKSSSIDIVESKLINAANSVSQSLNELAAIESANMPSSALPPPPNAKSIGMAAHASINWTGPVEPLILKLANAANYKLHVLGHHPAIPTIISVKAKDASLASILRDARFQTQKTAQIVVYPNSKIIELRYLSA